MRVFYNLDDCPQETSPIILAIGSFDGVHLGHQALISYARQKAQADNRQTWILTFDPLPAKILRPRTAPPLLTSTGHRVQLLASLGLDGCLVVPFTRELAGQEPGAFTASLCRAIPRLEEIVVGSNWTFGKNASGNPDVLQSLAARHGFDVKVIEPVQFKGSPVSSTRIREMILAGRLHEANEMLGRPFGIFGEIVRGRQVGRKLGFPTANISSFNEVLPPPGIYAAYMVVDGKRLNGAAYLPEPPPGKIPNIRSSIAEIFLFETNQDFYGRQAEMVFARFMREGRQFDTDQQLKEQIGRDVEEIKEFFKNEPAGNN